MRPCQAFCALFQRAGTAVGVGGPSESTQMGFPHRPSAHYLKSGPFKPTVNPSPESTPGPPHPRTAPDSIACPPPALLSLRGTWGVEKAGVGQGLWGLDWPHGSAGHHSPGSPSPTGSRLPLAVCPHGPPKARGGVGAPRHGGVEGGLPAFTPGAAQGPLGFVSFSLLVHQLEQ